MYHDVFDMDVVTVLPFYVIGPRKSQDAPSDFARKIIQFENGELDNLEVGNLNVERDVVDVRDAVKALQHIEKRAQSGSTYDLCTGQATTLKLILGRLISLSGSSIPISVCPDKFRKGENYRIIGNSKPLKNLGWKPKNELDDTLKSILDYWRTNQFVSNAS
jgi:GDP-4-dehydro-6-deoxy-D-mannose reductase